MAAQVSVREAQATDLTDIARIYGHYVVHSTATFEEVPPTIEDWAGRFRAINDGGLPFLVAEEADRICGYGYCGPWRPRAAYRHTVEDSIYVAPQDVGRGIGTALLEALVVACAAHGIRQMIAVIAGSEREASIRLHVRSGFRQAGRLVEVGFKHGQWLDTLLLQRSLAEEGPLDAPRPREAGPRAGLT